MRFLSLVALASLALAADDVNGAKLTPQDFAYARQIETPGKAAVYRVALPLDVYRKIARNDLRDLHVFNARGEPVPHVLKSPLVESTLRQPARQLPLFPLRGDPGTALDALRADLESGKATVNVQTESTAAIRDAILTYIADGRSLDTPVAALQLDWPSDAAEFAGRLQVEGSDDLRAWRTVADAAPVANLHSDGERLVEMRVEFPAARAKFWRLSWVGAAPSFALTGVRAEPAAAKFVTERMELTVRGKPVPDRLGEIAFDLGVRVPVDRINLELPERNSIVQIELLSRSSRAVPWQSIGKHGFYRLETRNGEMENGAVPISPSLHRYWLARVDRHGSGLGTGPFQLKAGWVPHELVFVASGKGPFELAYGSNVAPPLQTSPDAIPKNVPILRASLGAQRELVRRLQPAPPKFLWKSAVLWTMLALGAVLLAWMAFRRGRRP
jgi:hypothetical protein